MDYIIHTLHTILNKGQIELRMMIRTDRGSAVGISKNAYHIFENLEFSHNDSSLTWLRVTYIYLTCELTLLCFSHLPLTATLIIHCVHYIHR